MMEGICMSIDFTKAYDSVPHNCIFHVYCQGCIRMANNHRRTPPPQWTPSPDPDFIVGKNAIHERKN